MTPVRTAFGPGLLAGALLAVLLAACAPVQLRTQPAPISACDAALASGRLVGSAGSGLALADATGRVTEVVWPFGYVARREMSGIVLLEGEEQGARALAREGDWVEVGGGHDADGVFAVCPASLKVVSPPG